MKKTASWTERIRQARMAVGLTQPDFARELGISLRTLARYESGEREPKASVISRLVELETNQTGMPHHVVIRDSGTGVDQVATLDADLLATVLRVVDEELGRAGIEAPPGKKAEIVALCYDLMAGKEAGEAQGIVKRLVGLMG